MNPFEQLSRTESKKPPLEQFAQAVEKNLGQLPEGHKLRKVMFIVLALLAATGGMVEPVLGKENPIKISQSSDRYDENGDYIPSGPLDEIRLETMRGTKINGFDSQGLVTKERFLGDDGQALPPTGAPRIPNKPDPELVDLGQ